MKKLLFLIPVLLLLSCNAIKVKELELDYTQELRGKIKQITMITYRYPTTDKDTVIHKGKIVVFLDTENRVIKQVDYHPKFTDETNFIYENGLLQNKLSKSGKKVRKVTYTYDAHKNVIVYSQFENDTLYFSKTSLYDRSNNPVEQTYFFPKYPRNNSVDKFSYDYKNKIFTVQSFDENNKARNSYLKVYFNKKGYLIKTESINTGANGGISYSSVSEYDKKGNRIRNSSFDKDGKLNNSTEYKNTYDAKGNIIARENYMKGKLTEKTTYDIIYR